MVELVEALANKSGLERGWPTPIVLSKDDLTGIQRIPFARRVATRKLGTAQRKRRRMGGLSATAEDNIEAAATLHSHMSEAMGAPHPDPPRGSLKQMIMAALELPIDDRMSARISLEEGGSLGWTQIAAIAARNGILK